MSFIDTIKERAKADKKVIVLPESEDVRTYEAIEKVLKEDTADVILVASDELVAEKGKGFDISGAKIVDPEKFDRMDEYIDKLVELRQKKGMTREQASDLLHNSYTYFAVMMVKMGDADGMVSGACHSTADTLRPCLQILKTAPGVKLVSAFFVIVVPDCDMGEKGTFIFADSGMEQNPDPERLAAIAGCSADSFELLVQAEPKVAMLSHSTKGSASHPDVDKVVEATKIAKEAYPDLQLDGELRSYRLSARARLRAARSQDMPMSSSSRIWMQVISATNWPSGSPRQRPTARSPRESHARSTICPAAARQMILPVSLRSRSSSARQADLQTGSDTLGNR